MGEYFKKLGYSTAMIGKWHEEIAPAHHPMDRGFDEFFGFINGASEYFIGDNKKGSLLRGKVPVKNEEEYLTDAFGREAVQYIKRNNKQENPFLLYVAFNAPHGPLEGPKTSAQKFTYIKDEHKRILAEMISSLDENVGRIMSIVKKLDIEKNTLVVFYSDNGGVLNLSDNSPLRSGKGDIYEGGIRIPFCMQWKGHLPENRRLDYPVISLDILPTAIAASGNPIDKEWHLDGVNLLPYLTGEKQDPPHEFLFWRFLWHHAVRKGDWKLVKQRDHSSVELYNLARDIGEQNDLSANYPEIVKELQTIYDNMSDAMMPPQWGWQPDYCGSYKVGK